MKWMTLKYKKRSKLLIAILLVEFAYCFLLTIIYVWSSKCFIHLYCLQCFMRLFKRPYVCNKHQTNDYKDIIYVYLFFFLSSPFNFMLFAWSHCIFIYYLVFFLILWPWTFTFEGQGYLYAFYTPPASYHYWHYIF